MGKTASLSKFFEITRHNLKFVHSFYLANIFEILFEIILKITLLENIFCSEKIILMYDQCVSVCPYSAGQTDTSFSNHCNNPDKRSMEHFHFSHTTLGTRRNYWDISPCFCGFFYALCTYHSACIEFSLVFLAPVNCSTVYSSVSLVNIVFYPNFGMFALHATLLLNLCQGNENVSATLDHGRLARWRNRRACDVGKAKEGLENELWRRWSGLENTLWRR